MLDYKSHELGYVFLKKKKKKERKRKKELKVIMWEAERIKLAVCK